MWEQEVTAKASKMAMKTLCMTIAVQGGYKKMLRCDHEGV
jgi:hypothetical protein